MNNKTNTKKNSKNIQTSKNKASKAAKPRSERKIVNGAGRDVGHELFSLGILAVTVLLIVSFLDLAGTVGSLLKKIYFGMFGGLVSWFFVIILCYVVLIPFGKAAADKVKRGLSVLFLALSASAFVSAVTLPKGDLSLSAYIGKNINTGTLYTGGIIGGFFSYIFKLLFSEVGAMIIIITLILGAIIFISKYSFSQMFSGIKDLFKKSPVDIEPLAPPYERTLKKGNRDSRKSLPTVNEIDHRESEIRFKGFKDSAPSEGLSKNKEEYVQQRLTSKRESEEGNDDKNDSTLPGNITFRMKGACAPSEERTEEDPLKAVVKDMSGENRPNMLRETAREKIARNTGRTLGKDPEEEEKEDNSEQFVSGSKPASEYVFPSYDLLNDNKNGGVDIRSAKMQAQNDAKRLEATLKSFGVDAHVINISRGPTVTRYELQPNTGVKISKIVGLSDDIAMSLAAKSIRIEAPIPGKSAVGIEIPNKETEPVFLKDVITTGEFEKSKSKLTVCLGKDISGETVLADISKMPHTLIAGATGSGKSVCINTLIISMLYKARPDELKLIMIDPKVVELSVYNGIPHLAMPVVTDPKKAASALIWAVCEMERRYKLFAEEGVRDLAGYNTLMRNTNPDGVIPHYVIIVDELADLMMVAPGEIENSICRLAQMARAAGMHLIIATQRPSVDVITGVIKANIPSRIAFKVASQFDSRTILDAGGAEKLLGRGDMMFFPMGASEPTRIQGAFISDGEVERIVGFVRDQGICSYDEEVIKAVDCIPVSTGKKKGAYSPSASNDDKDEQGGNEDKLLYDAIEMVVESGTASASYLQRKFSIGYSRAARIIDRMEELGIVSGNDGSKPRQVLISKERYYEMKNSMSEDSE